MGKKLKILALFDAVRPRNGGPIGAEEGECFSSWSLKTTAIGKSPLLEVL